MAQLQDRIEAGCREALKSEEMQILLRQVAYEAASASSKRHLEALGIGSEDPAENTRRAESFRKNLEFVTAARERCEKVWDKSYSVIITIVVSGLVGGLYLLARHFVPTLPGGT